ncbi:DUF1496 domain-containing protein [Yersinia enterocolitica]|uniref:DUF1496 domain-containing protein n=1 Tax=Yersinia enterocolitica TaxID=630 RepID=UPI001C67191C|nr:DUF1496 domain-containing protein [Yersinia enterocolitica]MBW5831959.1 DUF1496 domain-containing protein [Yersinia enterocolitica]
MRTWVMLGCIGFATLISGQVLANRNNVDVVVPLPPEVWNNSSNRNTNNNPCARCCIYQNQNYSEGAVLRVEGEVLQCVRDPNVIGTNPLIWKRLTR